MVVMELKDELGPIPWPTFAEGVKQGGESMKEFYFHRCHEFDEVRYHQTFRRLLNGEQVAWLGTPGIGKCKSDFIQLLS